MTREQALDKAIANICQGPIDDYSRGVIERPELEKRIKNRREQIAVMVEELLRIAEPELCACGAKAVVVIAGAAYCAPCGAKVARPEPPVFAR